MNAAKIVLPEIVSTDFKPHWLEGIDDEKYHSDKTAVSSTALREALTSPLAFYRSFVEGKAKPATKSMNFGKAAHMAILEAERFRRTYVVEPVFTGKTLKGEESTKSKEANIARSLWRASLPKDARVLTQEEHDKLMWMMESLLRHEAACGLLRDAVFEVSGYFRDPVTGIKCRFRPDVLRMDMEALPDVKTTQDASEDSFSKSIWQYRYHVQLAFYEHGVEQIVGRKPKLPCFIAIENTHPFDVCVYAADEGMMDRGRTAFAKGLERVKAGILTGQWPGLQPTGAKNIALPAFTDYLWEWETEL